MSALRVCVGALVLLFARNSEGTEFYPYGPAFDKQLPKQDDVSSQEIPLDVPIRFYGESYNSIFVNSNGMLSFLTEIPIFFSIQFPLNYPIIAPLYSNIDTSVQGEVYYRETSDPLLIQRASDRIQQFYPRLPATFSAKSLFLATWVEVGYYPRGVDKVNTFQVVIASDGTETFVEFIYRNGGVQWVQGEGYTSGLPDARAQAGFVAEDNRLYTLRGSGTDQIKNLDRWSNVGEQGTWLFRVGNIGEMENVEPPQVSSGDNDNIIEDSSCQSGATFCHSKADCVDTADNFCCVCQQGYYGNGRTCLQDQIPLRVNGKMSVSLNDNPTQDVDVQAYIVTADGRSYTALSRVPANIGKDAQLVTSTSDIIGWLFAKSTNGAPNGYQLTGGIINHTAVLNFDGQWRTTVEQRFLGLDVYDQIRVEGRVFGKVPEVPLGSKLIIPDTQSQFRRTSPGFIESQSLHVVKVDNSQKQFTVSIDQSISFNEYCPSNVHEGAFRVKTARSFISYEETENILRFAASNKISSLSENDDPCVVGQASCVNNSHCIPEGSNFRCVCNKGFQTLYSEENAGDYGCVDINECQSGSHNCDGNALCINEVGSFSCKCRQGFTGNGYHCESVPDDCSTTKCHPGAECVDNPDIGPQCFCIPGFTGDGITCIPNAEDDCLECSQHAYCNHSQTGEVQCFCLHGFYGNGRECEQETNPLPAIETADTSDVSCNINNNCHSQAQCIYLQSKDAYECKCNPGYEGDGIDCSEIELSCKEADICHFYATCVDEEETGRSICECNDGYQGDGTTCYPTDLCKNDEDCGENAECVKSDQTQNNECRCNSGYIMDYNICIRQGCGDCHIDAECLQNPATGLPQCVCRSGFLGDGIEDCVPQPMGCNVLYNCAVDAECVYVSQEAGYRCQCKQGYEGNGTQCRHVNNCLNNASLCSSNALCVPGPSGYECQCNTGYVGNGFTCTEIRKVEGGFLLVNKGMATVKIPQEPKKSDPGRPIQLQYDQIAIGLDVDCVEGLVYWSDIASQVIKRSNLNGKDITVFVDKDISSPEGLAIDWISRKLYWTDSGKDVIKAASLDTGEIETIIDTGLVNPRGIAVHPTLRKVFWSDWNRAEPKLESANLDGSGRKVLVSQDVQLPNSLSIDWSSHELCWTDAGTKKIDCLGLNNGVRRTAISNCSYPFGLAITADKYYWSDWHTQKVETAFKYSSSPSESLTVPLGGAGKLYGITAVSDSCPLV